MRFEDHRLSLSQERSDHTWGSRLTLSEFDAELDDMPPRLRIIQGGLTCRRGPAATGTRPGVDRLSRHSIAHRGPSPHPSSSGAARTNFDPPTAA